MNRTVVLLFILGLGHSIYAASLFPFPDLSRRIPERPASPGCAYKGVRYEHGDSVSTPEPCLNCTCIRAVLVCYLRVCPTAMAPPAGCFAAREPGQCCPTLVCGGADLSKPSNKSGADIDLRPTFQPPQKETTSSANGYSTTAISTVRVTSTDSTEFGADGTSTVEDHSTGSFDADGTSTVEDHSTGSFDADGTSTVEEDGTSLFDTDGTSIFETDGTSTVDENGPVTVSKQGTTSIEVSEKTTTHDNDYSSEISPTDSYSTVSSTTFHSSSSKDDSLVYITSTGEPTNDYDMNFYNDIPAGGCMVNGTLYGDGSAMLSSTFCEYCFCIRGKSTCLKPKCHLAIEGCTPRYDNHYTCCPSRYECTQKTSSVEIGETTTFSSTVAETTKFLGDVIDCFVGGTVYHQGDLIPDHKACHNCYCKDSSVLCEKIKCSPPLEGCTPIIPQGYCCPISYRCDYDRSHLASNSIKNSKFNNSAVFMDGKGTDIKSVKNYYSHNNENSRVKTPTQRESISLLHNVVPIQRRLDQNSEPEQNSTVKSLDNDAVIQIGYGVPSDVHKYVNKNMDPVRENDKTLKLELNDTASLQPTKGKPSEGVINSFYREDTSHEEQSSGESVTLGSPVLHTLSIQQLFDQFFGRQKTNIQKVPDETSFEPKRNNSKQPTSIVEINDVHDDIPESTTIIITTENVQTTENDNKESNQDSTLSSETEDHKTHSDTSNEYLFTNSDSFSWLTDTKVTEIPDRTTRQRKPETSPSSLFSTTEVKSNGDFRTTIGTESTYPIFISTTNRNSEKDKSETDSYGELKDVTARETFDDQGNMDTSPSSHVYTTIADSFDLKSDSIPQTHPVFTVTDSRDIYNHETKQAHHTSPDYSIPQTHPVFTDTDSRDIYDHETKQTHHTSPDYSTTKAALIEELKSHTQTRPVVFIYDMKNLHSKIPTTLRTTQAVPSVHDTTLSSFTDETKDTSDAQTSLLDEATKIIIADNSDDQAYTSEISSTVEDLYHVLKNHGEILSVSPVHITTRNQNNLGSTDAHESEIHIFDTTRHVNQEEEVVPSSSPVRFFTTTKHANNYDQPETVLPVQSTSKQYVNNGDQTDIQSTPPHTSTINEHSIDKQQTLMPFKSTTKNSFETEDHLSDIHTDSRPVYNTETTMNINNGKITDVQNIFSSLPSTKHPHDTTENEQTLNTDQNTDILFKSTVSKNEGLSKTENYSPTEANLRTTKTPDIDYSIDIASDSEEIKAQKDTSTTETLKLSTRINSKLPSFNYGDKINQKANNVSTSNFPVLTDAFINTYLPVEGRDNLSQNDKNDFTNIGSIYLGAPLAVGGSDSRKEIRGGKPKITQSDGVIFLDPKFTDIDTKVDFESKKTVQTDGLSANRGYIEKTEKELNNSERKKGPRNQDQQLPSVIPFVAEDAVRGHLGKLNDTLQLQPGVTEGLPDIVSDFCFIKGRIYMNGEMIGKADPCELCRCFYGRELCQIQRCPTPPPDCVPDKVPGFCCPRFTCGNNGTAIEGMKLVGIVLPSEVSTSTTRRPDIIDRKPQLSNKQEMKFGIRVRVRPSPTPPVRIPDSENTRVRIPDSENTRVRIPDSENTRVRISDSENTRVRIPDSENTRVRIPDSGNTRVRIPDTEIKTMAVKTTLRPEIRTVFSQPSSTEQVTTTTRKPVTTSKIPTTRRTATPSTTTTTTTTTTTPSPLFPDPWGLLKVSGCNIYGKFFNINDQVEILSGPCSHCICTANGVECNDIC